MVTGGERHHSRPAQTQRAVLVSAAQVKELRFIAGSRFFEITALSIRMHLYYSCGSRNDVG